MDENKIDTVPAEVDDTVQADTQEDKPAKKKKKKKSGFPDKWAELWQEKRPFKTRLAVALLATAAFVYTFFVFGPLELYLSNMSFFAFSLVDMLLPLLMVGLALFALLGGILLLLRGKIFNYAVSLLFSFTLAGYLQGNFLNINHGTLDGTSVIWQEFRLQAALGLLFWAFMIVLPLIVQYFNRKFWRRAVSAISVLLMLIQTVALVVLVVRANINHAFSDITESGYLTNEEIYTVSDKQNVLVFMLDRFDKDYAVHQLEGCYENGLSYPADPDIAEGLKGFTFYENFTGSYTRTYPSVAYLLTGIKTDYSSPVDSYLKKAWNDATFLSGIRNAGYDVRVYTEINYVGGTVANMDQHADNISFPSGRVPADKVLSAMYNLSAFRYLPEYMKPYYHTYTGDLSYSYIYGSSAGAAPYGINDLTFREQLLKDGVTLDADSKGTFLFYHLQGSHDPFYMNGDGEKASFGNFYEGRYQQTKGNLKTIFAYIEMLKELGVYDETTIIITADHGYTGYYTELNHERLLSLFIKPAGVDPEAPLQHSMKQICQDNLRASISGYFGLVDDEGKDAYGNRTIESIGETEEMVRYFWMNGCDPLKTRRDVNLLTYRITGDANDFDNWELIATDPIEHPFYDAGLSSKGPSDKETKESKGSKERITS